jgi:hypothetical protein
MNKPKGRQSNKNKGYYKSQYDRTESHKRRRAARVEKRKAKWVRAGVKKNGQPVDC